MAVGQSLSCVWMNPLSGAVLVSDIPILVDCGRIHDSNPVYRVAGTRECEAGGIAATVDYRHGTRSTRRHRNHVASWVDHKVWTRRIPKLRPTQLPSLIAGRALPGTAWYGWNNALRQRRNTRGPAAIWIHRALAGAYTAYAGTSRTTSLLTLPELINPFKWAVADIRIHARPIDEPERIGLRIPADGGIVVPVPVVVQAGFDLEPLAGEAGVEGF